MNNQSENAENIELDESQGMDEAERELFINVKRSKSDDSFLGKLILNKEPLDRRQLIIDINENPNTTNNMGFRVFKKQRKQKKRNQSDYRKNICGYITKKIIRQFVSPNYAMDVQARCEHHEVQYQIVKSYYLAKIEQVTGPSHIPILLVPQNEGQVKIKKVFSEFFDWFLKERYLRYLLLEGKMNDKKAYIEYKNYMLLSMLNENENKDCSFLKMQDGSMSSSSSSESSSEQEPGDQPK